MAKRVSHDYLQPLAQPCPVCGATKAASFRLLRPDRRYCSTKCSERVRSGDPLRSPNGIRSMPLRERLTRNRQAVYERDGGRCSDCGEVVDATLVHPDESSMVFDHVLPLADGGTHHEDNRRLMHSRCNNLKAARDRQGVAAG